MISGYFYTLEEAAHHLCKGRTTLWRWRKSGKLTGRRIRNLVLIRKADIDAIQQRISHQAGVEEKVVWERHHGSGSMLLMQPKT